MKELQGNESQAGPRKVELMGYLTFWMADTKAVPPNFKEGAYIAAFSSFLEINFTADGHALPLSRFYDCCRKYIDYFQSRTGILEHLLQLFLSPSGATHSNHLLASKAVITFLRF